MTDLHSKSVSITPLSSKSSNLETELARVNKEIYERNVDLAIHNRTLSILSKIYEIINSTLGLKQTAQKLIESIVAELKFQRGFIALINPSTKNLETTAVSSLSPEQDRLMVKFHHPFYKLKISLNEKNNICIASVTENKRKMTNKLQEVLTPIISKEEAAIIAAKLSIQSSVIYPISFGGKPFGVLYLGMDKHVGDLSRFERETLKELIELVAIALERAKTYADLEIANKRLKELDQLKDEFVSIASHELRTPMTAIKSYLWMAINKSPQKLQDPLKKYLDISYQSTERLIHLVNDMLTVSRIERNKIEIKKSPVDVIDILRMVYEELKISATEKKINFVFKFDDGEKYIINADKDRIREVFQNLVGNALKFTPTNGKIELYGGKNEKDVKISVADNGTGIPKEEQGKLFQKFSKIDYSYSTHPSQPGTGLGLYISKQIVSLHGGEIHVESEQGKGSIFTVILPILQIVRTGGDKNDQSQEK